MDFKIFPGITCWFIIWIIYEKLRFMTFYAIEKFSKSKLPMTITFKLVVSWKSMKYYRQLSHLMITAFHDELFWNYFRISWKFVTKHRLPCTVHQTLITLSLENCFVSFFLRFSCHAQMQRAISECKSHPKGREITDEFYAEPRAFANLSISCELNDFLLCGQRSIVNYSARLDLMHKHKRELDRIKVAWEISLDFDTFWSAPLV